MLMDSSWLILNSKPSFSYMLSYLKIYRLINSEHSNVPGMKVDKNVVVNFSAAFFQVRDCVWNVIDIIEIWEKYITGDTCTIFESWNDFKAALICVHVFVQCEISLTYCIFLLKPCTCKTSVQDVK